MKSRILTVLLILSIMTNFYLVMSQPAQKDLSLLNDRINKLEKVNADLSMQVHSDNLSIQNYASQLDLYRKRIAYLDGRLNNTPTGLQGSAELQAPAVMQKVEYVNDYPFVRQTIVEEGSMMNISVEIRPGKGRVLVQTRPLMGVVFQDAANTAVFVAQNRTGKDLSGSDMIFSIEAQGEIPEVDGPSAGALMTLLVISALENQKVQNSLTLTGTIDQYGQVGEIGGVIEKAKAAKESGKTLILLPKGNSRLVQYTESRRNYYGITVIEQVPETIDAKEYIEKNIGITVEYVETISDVLKYAE
ncbi:MAG: ATP-dependent protease [Candidatus Methanoperedens sp.]|nr:ATP-dependent protease [Candidatus Methanoperedens sp.]MCZ7371311.1 ATP-dependent protease [Candidatus Methanoperedens sp.]